MIVSHVWMSCRSGLRVIFRQRNKVLLYMNALLEVNVPKFLGEYLRQKPKERIDTVLEPMQVMIQLALLSFCPIGTKISVMNNTMSLQWPTLSQGIWRWFNKDSKEDLYFLFNVVRRYYKWYKDEKIFKYLLELARRGLDRLIKTYEKSDIYSLSNTLMMYKTLLGMDDCAIFDTSEINGIDEVFKGITEVYDNKMLRVVYNTLRLMEEDEERKMDYYKGLECMLRPVNDRIRGWIIENMLV